jgi:hypothetical protein
MLHNLIVATIAKQTTIRKQLLNTSYANKHVPTATISLQQRNGVFYAVRTEILNAGPVIES